MNIQSPFKFNIVISDWIEPTNNNLTSSIHSIEVFFQWKCRNSGFTRQCVISNNLIRLPNVFTRFRFIFLELKIPQFPFKRIHLYFSAAIFSQRNNCVLKIPPRTEGAQTFFFISYYNRCTYEIWDIYCRIWICHFLERKEE